MIGASRRTPNLARRDLREAPFAPAPDARFFYAEPARQQCLDLLHHLAEYSEEWLLVTGPAGIGKTTLLDQFIQRADAHLRTCRVEGTDAGDGGQLFLRIAGAFGLDLARKGGDPLEALRAHLNVLQAEQVPVVAVDDADRLGDDALEILLHLAELQGEHGRLVRVVLFAAEEIQPRLAGGRFAPLSAPHRLTLRPFDEADTARYLIHRMSVAGYEGPNPFDAAAVRRVFRESGGVPGAIHRAADGLLREGPPGGSRPGVDRARRALLPAAVFAALAGAGMMLQDPLGALFGPPLSADEAIPTVPGGRAGPPGSGEPVPLAARPLVLREGESVQVACSPLEPETKATPPPGEAPGPASAAAPAPASIPAPATAVPQATPPDPAPVARPRKPVPSQQPAGIAWLRAQRPTHFTLQRLAAGHFATVQAFLKRHPPQGPYAVLETNGHGAPLYLVIAGSYPTRAAALAARQRETVQSWPRPFGELQAMVTPATVAAPAQLEDDRWIQTREPGRFTLQLAAADRRQAVLNQVGRPDLPGPVALFTTERHGRPLFVAVHGDYPDEPSARRAYETLPLPLRQGSPLVRGFAELQTGLIPEPQNAPPPN